VAAADPENGEASEPGKAAPPPISHSGQASRGANPQGVESGNSTKARFRRVSAAALQGQIYAFIASAGKPVSNSDMRCQTRCGSIT